MILKNSLSSIFTAIKVMAAFIIGNSRIACLILVLGSLLSACSTVPGKDLPRYTYSDLAPPPEDKICLSINEVAWNKNREDMEAIITIFEKSGYFLKAPEHCTSSGNPDQNKLIVAFGYDLKFSSFVGGVLTGFLSGLTLTIFPLFDRDDYILTVQLKSSDQLIKQYIYHEHIMTTMQLFFLFQRPNHSSREPIREIYDAMIMNFLYDYSHDLQQGAIAWKN